MRRRNDGAGSSPQGEFEDVCFHALGIIDQNREYLQMHLLASADLPTRQALSDIQIESARVSRTVHNAMLLYRLENGEPCELQPFDVSELLEKAERMAPDIEKSLEIQLMTEREGVGHCVVMGAPDEAEQLLLHLISNALCACDPGGRVWVSLKQRKTDAVLRVEDDGCGLMEEDPIENNRRFLSGAKLGLRICRLICRRAGWKLTLTARPGGGTRAQVAFPLASGEAIPPELVLHSEEGEAIRAARFASRAAQEMGLSNSTVTKWKNTGATPSGETLARVSAYFGVPVGELLGEAFPSVQEERKLPEGAVPFDPALTAPLLGTVRAGLPMYAEENIEGYIPITRKDGARYFWLRVRGDSMNAMGISENDEILVREQPEVENGQLAVVMVNGDEATVKYFRQEGSLVVLTPKSFNPMHQPQIYDLKRVQVRVVGLVVECRKVF